MLPSVEALFIKLGSKGEWEENCLTHGVLRLGYGDTPHDACIAGRWGEVEEALRATSKSPGAATRHLQQIQSFYEAGPEVVWITFSADRLYWCKAGGVIEQLADRTKTRNTELGWRGEDVNGKPLLKATLSGALLAVQGFRGTIGAVPDVDYLMHKLNGTVPPDVLAAETSFELLVQSRIPLIKSLHDREFEPFVDLLFRETGWSRVARLGGTTPDIDLDLISTTTNERIAVQVKSRADLQVYRDYVQRFAVMSSYSHFFFTCHTPSPELRAAVSAEAGPIILWDAEELSRRAVSAGLCRWLMDRAS